MGHSIAMGGAGSRTRTRGKRGWLAWFLIALALLAAAYTALWFYVVDRAGHEVDAWVAGEAQKGRIWTCAGRRFYGYPLQIGVGCRAFGFRRADGTDVTVSGGAVDVSVALYDPNTITAVAAGPWHLRGADGSVVGLEWSGLRIDASGPLKLDQATVRLLRPHLRIVADGVESALQASEATLGLHAAGGGANPPDVAIAIRIAALQSPILDDSFGSSEPLDANVAAVASGVLALRGAMGVHALERWQANGGRLDITSAVLTKGAARIDVRGRIGLDQSHRLHGDLLVALAGLDSVMKHYGLSGGALSFGSLLVGFLGNPAAAAPAPTGAPATTFPLKLADGRVSLGPFPLAVKLKPLY